MLHQINKVKDFGILDISKSGDTITPFNKLNLIYGWNGSGKTTLGRLFRCLESKLTHVEFDSSEFTIGIENGKIESKNIEHNLDIRVFNQDFVTENLNLFDAKTKPIIFISKEKIDEKKELDQKKNEFKEKEKNISKIKGEVDSLERQIDDFHKNAGKSIKDFFLGTVYANVTYNKSTSSKIWTTYLKQEQSLENFYLTEDKLSQEKEFTLLNSKKDQILDSTLPIKIELEKLKEVEGEVNRLLTVNISSKVIERLKDNPKIGNWVASGLSIHREYESKTCEFCGQPLQVAKIKELENHFSKEYSDLIEKITELIETLKKGLRTELRSENHLIYDNLKSVYDSTIYDANQKLILVNKRIDYWIKLLKDKKSNPFKFYELDNTDNSIFLDFNDTLAKLKEVINQHNKIGQSHQKSADKAKTNIENHFVSQAAINGKIKDVEIKLEDLKGNFKAENESAEILEINIKKLEDSLRSDTLAIGEINENIHKFLGRNDITLIRLDDGGYQLKRGKIIARNLSEGEKTAISLIYFFSKIQEGDADKANQIIVLDDPISSFDSNHLFNASSYIKSSTDEVKQLFVLTHNFWFFKQVRDWMFRKNSKDKIVANVYLIRKGIITDASNSLTKFHSEYQHVFKTVLGFQNMLEIDESTCFTIANSIRRLLEAFTSFKCPDDSGFNGALQLGVKKGLSTIQKERIYYFAHKYSHLDRIEFLDNTVEPIIEEGKNVVHDVLWLIKKVDEDHYKSMLKVCGCEDKIPT